jgi:hypothetical protein
VIHYRNKEHRITQYVDLESKQEYLNRRLYDGLDKWDGLGNKILAEFG